MASIEQQMAEARERAERDKVAPPGTYWDVRSQSYQRIGPASWAPGMSVDRIRQRAAQDAAEAAANVSRVRAEAAASRAASTASRERSGKRNKALKAAIAAYNEIYNSGSPGEFAAKAMIAKYRVLEAAGVQTPSETARYEKLIASRKSAGFPTYEGEDFSHYFVSGDEAYRVSGPTAVSSGDITATFDGVWYDPDKDAFTADVTFTGRGATKQVTVTLPIGDIRRRVHLALSRHAVSGIWDSIKNAASAVVKKTGVAAVVKKVGEISQSPAFKSAMGIAGAIYPPLGVTYGAVSAGVNMVNQLKKGDPGAMNKLKNIVQLANGGDPAAQQAGLTLSTIYKADKEGVSADEQRALAEQIVTRTVVPSQVSPSLALQPNATATDIALSKAVQDFYGAVRRAVAVAGDNGVGRHFRERFRSAGWLWNPTYRSTGSSHRTAYADANKVALALSRKR